jgi:hypothetical protein
MGDVLPPSDDEKAQRGGLNQKPRTMGEAHKAWGRRIRRWLKKNKGPGTRSEIERVGSIDPAGIPSDAAGLLWVRKGSALECGVPFSDALFAETAPKAE